MAWSTVSTEIQNPARKKNSMAKTKKKRHLTPKQIRAGFGGKRRKTSLRKKKSHRPRTKKRNTASYRPKPHGKKKSSHRPRTRAKAKQRSNPVAEIISWTAGNPAKKGKKHKMAQKKRKKSSASHRNAGRPKKHMTRRRHRNPAGLGRPMDWVQGGAGVLAGVLGTRALPQLILGPSNTGPMGYAANAIAALALGWGAHALFKKPVITTAVVAGGFASLFSRIIADKTPYGAQFSLSGLGDWGLGLYQKSNFNRPQHLVNGRPGTPGSSMFAYGPGAPYGGGLPSLANAGADGAQQC
jgi:hypothetical protein